MTDIEADQSGKIEDLKVDTILAFSNDCRKAIRIPASVKLAGMTFLRQRRISRKTRYLRMLAGGFYLLLKDQIKNLGYIQIDVEFSGHEEDLRNMLLILIWRDNPYFSKDRLVFYRVGKKSPAHYLALQTYRGKRAAEVVITKEEFIDVLT